MFSGKPQCAGVHLVLMSLKDRPSDIFAMYQSLVMRQFSPDEFALECYSQSMRWGDYELLVEMIDWESDVKPESDG